MLFYQIYKKSVPTLKDALYLICKVSDSAYQSLTDGIKYDCYKYDGLDDLFNGYDNIVNALIRSTVGNHLVRQISPEDLDEIDDFEEVLNENDQLIKDAYTSWDYITGGGNNLLDIPIGVYFGWEKEEDGSYTARVGYRCSGAVTRNARKQGMEFEEKVLMYDIGNRYIPDNGIKLDGYKSTWKIVDSVYTGLADFYYLLEAENNLDFEGVPPKVLVDYKGNVLLPNVRGKHPRISLKTPYVPFEQLPPSIKNNAINEALYTMDREKFDELAKDENCLFSLDGTEFEVYTPVEFVLSSGHYHKKIDLAFRRNIVF